MSEHYAPAAADETGLEANEQPQRRGVLATAWNAVTALVGGVMGLLPHLLHHVGLLGGAVLVTGATGNVLFAVLGLLLSLPLLRRLYRRFGTWKAPALALAIFAVMFSLSAFVIGPAISDDGPSPDQDRTPVQTPGPRPRGPSRRLSGCKARFLQRTFTPCARSPSPVGERLRVGQQRTRPTKGWRTS